MTHPAIVENLSELAGVAVRYFAIVQNGECVAAIPTWGRYLALSRQELKRRGQRDCFDLGNAETILPMAPGAKFVLHFEGRYLSELHEGAIRNQRRQRELLAICRAPEEYSKKFHYNQRRELRLFEEQGGSVHDLLALSAEDIAETYSDLFARRWGFPVPAKGNLTTVMRIMRPYMFGSVLRQGSRHVAIQILYRVESPKWISAEYINGGVDPDFQSASPGSVLSYLNTQSAWIHARGVGKSLRYSFGRADRDYKMRWCHASPVFSTS